MLPNDEAMMARADDGMAAGHCVRQTDGGQPRRRY